MKYIILYLLSRLYLCIVVVHSGLYKFKILKPARFSVPLLSIGNILMGGAGKTPMVVCFSKLLHNKNIKHVIVSRGYKKQSKGTVLVSDGKKPVSVFVENAYACGDEAYLMAVKLPNTPIVVDENKIIAINFAIKKFNPDLILLDDAFQSLYLDVGCNVVLHNSAFNNTALRLFPLGNLRQPLKQLSRADFILQINRDYRSKTAVLQWDCNKAQFIPNLDLSISDRAFVFCGLANPKEFLKSVQNLRIEVVLEKSYADHFEYQNNTKFKKDCLQAKKLGALVFLTTYKDFVKLQNDSCFMDADIIWKILDLEYCLVAAENTLDGLLAHLSINK